MISSQQRDELVAEFSELSDPETILQKEVYAHFGLLFFKFGLVEHSLINALTFHYLGKALAGKQVGTKDEWEQAHDKGTKDAVGKTFGNLVRAISTIDEFKPFSDQLTEIKGHRDYFAHHFFREEVGMYKNDEGCWHVLWAIKQLREKIIILDRQLSLPTENMCRRLGVPLPTPEILQRLEEEL